MYEEEFHRITRSLTQPIFLVEENKQGHYKLQGTTGYYKVVLQNAKAACTCPDFYYRRHLCKHIFFVMLKVPPITPAAQTVLARYRGF